MDKNLMGLYAKAYSMDSPSKSDETRFDFDSINRKKASLMSELEVFKKAANLYAQGIQEIKYPYFRFSGVKVTTGSDFLITFDFHPVLLENDPVKRTFSYKELSDYIKKLKMTIKDLDKKSTQLYLKMKKESNPLVKVNATIEALESRLEALKELRKALKAKEA